MTIARNHARSAVLVVLLTTGMALAFATSSHAASPWRSAAAARCATTLDEALTTLDRTQVAGRSQVAATSAASSAATCLETAVRTAPTSVQAPARRAIADARRAIDTRGVDRAVARAATTAALRVTAAAGAIAAVEQSNVDAARVWLVLRERRPATRIGVPDAPSAAAAAALTAGTIDASEAARVLRDDLTNTTSVVLHDRLAQAVRAANAGLDESAAVHAAGAAAAWHLLAPPNAAVDRLDRLARQNPVDVAALARTADAVDRALDELPSSELDVEQATAIAGKLNRFIELVPVEYGRGVRDGAVSSELEIQEARSFLRGATDAWTALEPTARALDDAASERVTTRLVELDALVLQAETTPDDAASADAIQSAADGASAALADAVPDAWLTASTAADLELVRSALTNLEASARRGDWRTAEQARVEAYGAFEFGPELRLRAIDPGLAIKVEELIWFGDGTDTGLATLIAHRAGDAERAATLDSLDTQLGVVEKRLGTEATPGAIRTNSAIIVVREGMEAVLILAALTAGLSGAAGGRWRRPILVGGLLALIATAITFVLARALLGSLARFGERLEVVVSLVAIGVLLLILNWFVHKAYWTGWMASFQKKKVAITGTARERREAEEALAAATDSSARRATVIAQFGGLVVLGFTSIYREGFETVLFLQALVLDAGTLPVIEGAAIGLAAVTALAVLTIGLQRRMPYRRMLIVTGVLIAVVLAAMVGGTVQAMQAVGWMSVHPIAGLHVPAWASTWLGVHPTWEAVSLQFASIVFVIGSYVVAEWWQERKRLQRRAATALTTKLPERPLTITSDTSSSRAASDRDAARS